MTVKQKPLLTPSEKAAEKAYRAAKRKAGGWPELSEIARELGKSSMRAFQLMESLTAKGRFVKVGRYRGYRLVKKAV